MPRKPAPLPRRLAVLAVELAGATAILVAVALVWWPAALVLFGVGAIAAGERWEDVF